MPQYRPNEPEKGWIIPKAFQAFLREKPAEDLIATLRPKPTPTQREHSKHWWSRASISSLSMSFFAMRSIRSATPKLHPIPTDANRQAMIYALLMSNSLWYPLRYPAEYEGGQTINQRIHYHYPTAEDIRIPEPQQFPRFRWREYL